MDSNTATMTVTVGDNIYAGMLSATVVDSTILTNPVVNQPTPKAVDTGVMLPTGQTNSSVLTAIEAIMK